MRSTILFAVVLVLKIGVGNGHRVSQEPTALRLPQSPASAGQIPPPDLQGFPTAPAPDELATVALPDTISAVTALFERLPAVVAGICAHRRSIASLPERPGVGYGEDPRISGMSAALLWLQAGDLSRGDFFPTNWTGGQVVGFMARGKETDGSWPRWRPHLDPSGDISRCVRFFLSDLRYTECCGAESTALGCSPSRPTLARIVMHCLPPLSLRPSLHRDSSPGRYPPGPNPRCGRPRDARRLSPFVMRTTRNIRRSFIG